MATFPHHSIKGKQYDFDVTTTTHGAESPVGIRITIGKKSPFSLAEAALGFEKNILVVEGFYGRKNAKELMDQLSAALQKPWAKYLIEQAEAHARRMGFKTVKIIHPKAMYSYHWITPGKPQHAERKGTMYRLMTSAAIDLGYRHKGLYFVKELE